jgi:hypothetical protein
MPTPATPPKPTAADPAITTELMVWLDKEVRLRSPSAMTLVLSRNASTWTGVSVPSGVQPMKLRATETPIEAPTPATPPPPIASEAATTVDEIFEVLAALIVTSSALSSKLSKP